MKNNPRNGKLRFRPNPQGLWSEHAGDPPLTRQQIIRVALALLEGEGFDAFSMRGLATELDIKSPSLYHHFRSKEELFDLVVDTVLGECELPADDGTDWRERLAEVARELRRVLMTHTEAARLITGRVPLGPNWLRVAEYVIGTLRKAGFSDQLANYAYLVLIYYAIGFVSQEIAFGGPEVAGRRLQEMHDFVRTLPPDRYPNLVAVTGLNDRGLTDRFELGLSGILGGFADELARSGATTP
ncbi:TetR/AcrR family transcriptional regulator [Paractinoplanes toevensis]|uniref:Transcriptional regulator n=1 Tax=Paractinoplanes toevensis TaxID=571911 RepID=A0A919TED7_9ACTN|nr:TetR/AcrR family transcriptional regulator [Actinoplanes toevensis]GIM92624.1 transcriptional regulator [Actinoplanes toevensis]